MIDAYWATNGKSIWFRFDGKVYVRTILKLSPNGMPKVRFQGSTWYMKSEQQRESVEDIINKHVDLRYKK